jgi:hypothetical protein
MRLPLSSSLEKKTCKRVQIMLASTKKTKKEGTNYNIVNPLTYWLLLALTNDKSTFRPVISIKQKQNNKIMLLK